MEYQEDNADRKRKVRIITAICAVAVVMLGIGAWAIVSAINSVSDPASVATKELKKVEPAENNTKVSSTSTEEATVSEETSEEASTESVEVAVETTPNTSADVENMPSTGPVSLATTALLIGVAVYLVVLNRNMVKA